MIELKNVGKTYRKDGRDVAALPPMDLSVQKGEFVAVCGPSGSGKTTLLLMVGGMVRPTGGKLLVDDVDIYGLSPRRRAQWRAQTVGFVFQMFHLLPYATVLENILLPALAGAPVTRQGALELLDSFGLSQRAKHRPAELSTGERQRAAIARALLRSPPIVLADEPTGNLDPDSATTVMNHLAEYHKQGGTVLLVTHESLAAGYAQRVVNLSGQTAGVKT